jgi:ubiquitin carboxyl-terminal hydrolase 5/13
VYLGPGESPIKPEEVEKLCKSIVDCDSAYKKAEVQAWELQIHPCEHTLTLDQTGASKIAAKSLAHCGLCDLDNNLWICLVCGHLGCGRKFYDGSGGNGHALSHFEQTGHALAVKSGTISSEGQASVYCYACDNDVKDDNLPDHLLTLGIKVEDMKKTEKTMTELNLEKNLTLTLSNSYEKGKKLVPVFGERKTGLENIGNSCYMASVLQCLSNLPEIESRYHKLAGQHMDTCTNNPHECFICQTCKLFSGLLSGDYSEKKTEEIHIPSTGETQITEYQDGIKPYMFRHIVGKGHSEFSTHKQQDAMEYLIHLLSILSKNEGNSKLSPIANLFEFLIETRCQCPNCPAILSSEISSKFLNLPVPLPKNFETYGDTGKQEDMDYTATLDECIEL